MTTMTAGAPAPGGGFQTRHAWDRYGYIAFVLMLWVGIIMGFGTDSLRHFSSHERPYPLIVHFHALAFMSWMVLLTVQTVLIRADRRDLHRRLGFAMVGLAAVMLVLGPATALVADHGKLGTPDSDPPFLSVQFMGIIGFAALVAAAVALRKDAASHKRLILLGALAITDAGFARWTGPMIGPLLGHTVLGWWAGGYLVNDVVLVALGAYDLATRRRLHPAYLAGAAVVLGVQGAATWLYFSPAWGRLALWMIQKA